MERIKVSVDDGYTKWVEGYDAYANGLIVIEEPILRELAGHVAGNACRCRSSLLPVHRGLQLLRGREQPPELVSVQALPDHELAERRPPPPTELEGLAWHDGREPDERSRGAITRWEAGTSAIASERGDCGSRFSSDVQRSERGPLRCRCRCRWRRGRGRGRRARRSPCRRWLVRWRYAHLRRLGCYSRAAVAVIGPTSGSSAVAEVAVVTNPEAFGGGGESFDAEGDAGVSTRTRLRSTRVRKAAVPTQANSARSTTMESPRRR